MKLEESFRQIRGALKQAGVEASELEAEWIIEHLSGLSAIERIKNPDREFEAALVERALAMADRRAGGEPLAYILGEKHFFGLTFW